MLRFCGLYLPLTKQVLECKRFVIASRLNSDVIGLSLLQC